MKELCVVHLVRAANGLLPLQRFLESYRVYPAGIDHDLIVVLKGFEKPHDQEEYRALLLPFNPLFMEVSDKGVDITAYQAAIKEFGGQYRYFCFLNSFSRICGAGWLQKLYAHIVKPETGLAGASGSWVSHRTSILAHICNPFAYIHSMRNNPQISNQPRSKSMLIVRIIDFLSHLLFYLTQFDPYPNPFIRTNGFIIAGELYDTLNMPLVLTKLDAYSFESGKQGLSKRIRARGLHLLVVGKDGKAYTKEEWASSNTLFQGNQENLLVADNRTDEYMQGSHQRRAYLRHKAWH